jgi:hypothetical protein
MNIKVVPTACDLESQGRLMLWRMALNECQHLLELAARAEEEMKSSAATEKEERYKQAFSEFAKTQPDYVSDQIKGMHFDAFKKMQKREFGAFTDCSAVKDYCRMLAIVFFCQILNDGHRAPGSAAENDKAFRNGALEEIKRKLCASLDEKRFDNLCVSLKTARDEMIGHADGNGFGIEHSAQWRRAKVFSSALQGIDFEYWQSLCNLCGWRF